MKETLPRPPRLSPHLDLCCCCVPSLSDAKSAATATATAACLLLLLLPTSKSPAAAAVAPRAALAGASISSSSGSRYQAHPEQQACMALSGAVLDQLPSGLSVGQSSSARSSPLTSSTCSSTSTK
jgi:hypothetical protein